MPVNGQAGVMDKSTTHFPKYFSRRSLLFPLRARLNRRIERSMTLRTRNQVACLLASTFMCVGVIGCAKDIDTSELEQGVNVCPWPAPTATECLSVYCDEATETWTYDPVPAGWSCSGGQCDGNGACVPYEPPPAPPPAPANLHVAGSTPNSLTLQWDPSARADHYYVALDNGFAASYWTTFAGIDGLTDGVPYCAVVWAVNASGSAYAQVCGTTPLSPSTVVTSIVNQNSGMCLEVVPPIGSGYKLNSLAVLQRPCNGSLQQSWSWRWVEREEEYEESIDIYHIVNQRSGMCLDMTNGNMNNGTALQQYACVDSTSMGWFTSTTSNAFRNIRNHRALEDTVTPKCVDIRGGSQASDAVAQIYTCTSGTTNLAQRFQFQIP